MVGKSLVPSSVLPSSEEDGWRSIHLAVLDPCYLLGPLKEVNGYRLAEFEDYALFSGR